MVCVLAIIAVLAWADLRDSSLMSGGSKAPEFSVEQLDGGTLKLSQLKGKVVLLDFWATWCGPCQHEMPWLTKLAKELASRGVVFVAASADEEKLEVTEFLYQMPALKDHVVYSNPRVQEDYRVEALPTVYVIDRAGNVVASKRGETSEASVRKWLEGALK